MVLGLPHLCSSVAFLADRQVVILVLLPQVISPRAGRFKYKAGSANE